MKQLVIRIAILAFIWTAVEICQHFSAPQYALVNRNFALAAVNGGDAEMTASQMLVDDYATRVYGSRNENQIQGREGRSNPER